MRARRFTHRRKLEAVREILAGRRSLSETARAFRIQRYQLQAWCGLVCGDSPRVAYDALRERFERAPTQRPGELEQLTPGVASEYLSPPAPSPARSRR